MIKAVAFFDLDGTLLDSQKRVQKSSLAALAKLKRNHVMPVISTGRNLLMLRQIIHVTGIGTVVGGNGSYVYRNHHTLGTIPIPQKLLRELAKMGRKYAVPLSFQMPGRVALTRQNDLSRRSYASHHLNPPVEPDFYLKHSVNFVNLFTANRDRIFQNQFRGQLNIVRNSDKCLDVMRAGVNKQVGIRMLLRKLNLTRVPTYAFGDGVNDLEMLRGVDHSVSMANGQPVCRRAANFVTTSNDHNGIERGLAHFNLI